MRSRASRRARPVTADSCLARTLRRGVQGSGSRRRQAGGDHPGRARHQGEEDRPEVQRHGGGCARSFRDCAQGAWPVGPLRGWLRFRFNFFGGISGVFDQVLRAAAAMGAEKLKLFSKMNSVSMDHCKANLLWQLRRSVGLVTFAGNADLVLDGSSSPPAPPAVQTLAGARDWLVLPPR